MNLSPIQRWKLISCAGIFLLCASEFASAAVPPGECDITAGGNPSLPPCPSGNPNNVPNVPLGNPNMVAVSPPTWVAVRSDQGAPLTAVDAPTNDMGIPANNYWICRYITNNSSGSSIFVPFKSKNEWEAFVSDVNNGGSVSNIVSFAGCSRPYTFSISTGKETGCFPVPPANSVPPQQANFPYEPYDIDTQTGSTQKVILQFSCTADAQGDNPWIQTATVTSLGLDSDKNNPSWTDPPTVQYSPPPNGNCGTDEGVLSTNGPWNDDPSGLCVSGASASNESHSNGNWTWDCTDGSNNKSSCKAPIAMPAFSAGCAVDQLYYKSGLYWPGEIGNNESSSSCRGFGASAYDNISMSVGFVLGKFGTCCGEQYQWNLGEYANSGDPPGTIDWSSSGRFSIQWSGQLDAYKNSGNGGDQYGAIHVPNGIYTESVTVTDGYNGQYQTMSVRADKQISQECPTRNSCGNQN